jgi:acetamidase/formamidase
VADHKLEATPETVRWGYWDGSLAPVLTIASGDRVVIDTVSGEPEDMPDAALGFTILDAHRAVLDKGARGSGPHFLTGPIAIEGAEPGDVLEVLVESIDYLQDWGWNVQLPLHGTLPEDFPELRRLHVPIDMDRGEVAMPWGQTLALAPFFGNIGVAPPLAHGRLSSVQPRAFGGNMDNKELGTGTTIYFPVFRPGALFSVGDGHALQGDGEVCLSAIETALRGSFRFVLHKGRSLKAPRAETAETWITMGFDPDLDDAAKQALREMISLIGELSGLSPQDAYTLCSIAADLRITQTVDQEKGVHCVIAKKNLPARPGGN